MLQHTETKAGLSTDLADGEQEVVETASSEIEKCVICYNGYENEEHVR